MSKFTLFILVNVLLISIVVGGDISGIGRSPLVPKTSEKPIAVTPTDVCVRLGHSQACRALSRNVCSQLKCWTVQRTVVNAQAPEGMWCGPFQACRSGVCQVQHTMREPTRSPQFANCP